VCLNNCLAAFLLLRPLNPYRVTGILDSRKFIYLKTGSVVRMAYFFKDIKLVESKQISSALKAIYGIGNTKVVLFVILPQLILRRYYLHCLSCVED
jgi:hypothetical protein